MVFNTTFNNEDKKGNCKKALENCIMWSLVGGCIGVDGFLNGVSHAVSESMYNQITALYVVSLDANNYNLTLSDINK